MTDNTGSFVPTLENGHAAADDKAHGQVIQHPEPRHLQSDGTADLWDDAPDSRTSRDSGLTRAISHLSAKHHRASHHGVAEKSFNEKSDVSSDEWEMASEVRDHKADLVRAGLPDRKLGIEWNHLTVRGKGSDAVLHETVLSQLDLITQIKQARRPTPEKTILDDNFGVVKPGEMLLVLARPGGGATTLLRVLSNQRGGFSAIEGDVKFGTMDSKQAAEYHGQIVMNGEEEIFYPSMTVEQTLTFATALKAPSSLPDGVKDRDDFLLKHTDFLLRSMGIAHTRQTKVGDAYTRGVSGGERKRVSILEVLATRGATFCWDNSTRGLDASTALAWAQAIRTLTDVLGLTSIVTLYQAGNGIYNLFDKVLVLDEGKQIFYGPREKAQSFFEGLGFEYTDGANVGDFLTGVVVPTERRIKPGYEQSFPRTAVEIRDAYQRSTLYSEMQAEIGYADSEEARINTDDFKLSVLADRHKSLPKHSPLTVPFLAQIWILTRRQYQQIWGQKAAMLIRQGSGFIQALVTGSLFYQIEETANGLFMRGGVLFFSVMYNSLVAMTEVQESFEGRDVLIKHKQFAFFHPTAFVLAQVMSDIPLLLVQISIFSIVLYFMAGLWVSAASFFTYWIVVFSITMCMTAFFRSIASAFGTFNDASKVSGLLVYVTISYGGFLISKPSMKPWFAWIWRINPLAYALESLMGNELHGRQFSCTANNLIPSGEGYTQEFAACAGVPGSTGTFITGDNYLSVNSWSNGHVWRNVGIVWSFFIFFVALTSYFTTFKISSASTNTMLTFIRNKHTQARIDGSAKKDVEATVTSSERDTPTTEDAKTQGGLIQNTSVLTWRNLKYTVKVPGGERLLLDNINGFIKPGQLGALMGSSGAGKTTLLDVLAQRKTDGSIQGQIHVDGRPLPLSFQRSAGYCEQLDVHESLATVREALEFSAILRQPRGTSREDKLAYVDTIIQLLEMQDIEHALIGRAGKGLGVEQRKRLTIGVELVAKPSILIFLDEPTSGLDSQSAFSIVRFLRKLADVGQAVLVTIHQPSASLFYQFDTLLLLARGGKTVYNGSIGENAADVKKYFAREGAPCPENGNVGEHMIDVITGPLGKDRDWAQIWLDSPENKEMMDELEQIEQDTQSRPVAYVDDGHEYATPWSQQYWEVLKRNSISLYRDTDYINNKILLHISLALFNGFTFWKIGSSAHDLQNKMFSIFGFIFVAPGVIAQVQPLFIARRDIFEAREKKSKMYSWWAFCYGLIVSEFPYLVVCAVLYFCCWWFTSGFPATPSRAGAAFFEVLLYELLYTGIAQFISAYAPTAAVANLTVPLLLGTLISFCGVLVPYTAITTFWKYWIYYLNPFTFLSAAMLWFATWDSKVVCKREELAIFDTPNGQTCQSYLSKYLTHINPGANLLNPDATSQCEVCPYNSGTAYLRTINITHSYDGWRNIGITVIFCLSSYALVFALMKLRTKKSKTAE